MWNTVQGHAWQLAGKLIYMFLHAKRKSRKYTELKKSTFSNKLVSLSVSFYIQPAPAFCCLAASPFPLRRWIYCKTNKSSQSMSGVHKKPLQFKYKRAKKVDK